MRNFNGMIDGMSGDIIDEDLWKVLSVLRYDLKCGVVISVDT